jgi:hypothetical protein
MSKGAAQKLLFAHEITSGRHAPFTYNIEVVEGGRALLSGSISLRRNGTSFALH